MAEPLPVAILGLGHLHPRTYMPHLAATEGVEVVAVADPLEELRNGFAEDFGVRTYGDWRELLESEAVGWALVFLPHDECPDAAVACAEKGIPVVVEKPAAADVEGARREAQACREAGVLFSTPYLWRYHPVCREMKRIVEAGLLGRIVGCEGRCAAGGIHRYVEGHSPWMLQRARSGGGPMMNLGVHWIDLFHWLLDDEIVEVQGRNVHVGREYDIEDNSFALATFGGGATLSLDISYTVPDSYPYGRDLYLALRGTEGVLQFTPAFEGTRQELFVCSNDPAFGGAPRRRIAFELAEVPGYCGSLGLEYVGEIARNIREGSEPFIGAEDAVRVLEVVDAIYRAAESGKAETV